MRPTQHTGADARSWVGSPWQGRRSSSDGAQGPWRRSPRPLATKRALRAILKAADICTLEPEQAARFLVDKGYGTRDDDALQTTPEVPYHKWREYDPEETVTRRL